MRYIYKYIVMVHCMNNQWTASSWIGGRGDVSLVPRPPPHFISQPWRKLGISPQLIKSGSGLGTRLPRCCPISRSPQCSWWGLVLADRRPAQWVTLHNSLACFIREMWFVDCSCLCKVTPLILGPVQVMFACLVTDVAKCRQVDYVHMYKAIIVKYSVLWVSNDGGYD